MGLPVAAARPAPPLSFLMTTPTSSVHSRHAAAGGGGSSTTNSNRRRPARSCADLDIDDGQERERHTQQRWPRRPGWRSVDGSTRPNRSDASVSSIRTHPSCRIGGAINHDASPLSRGGFPLSRQEVLESTASGVVAGFLAGVGLASIAVAGVPAAANAEPEQQLGRGEGALEEYSSPDGSFSLRYPASFKGFSKPLKTHKVEVNFKSEEIKGFEVGVAIDPVRIESLESFGTPEEVGARVLKVEQGKDGTLETKLLDASAEKQGDLSLYTLDYFVESTRGFKHFVAKVTIKDNLLYACTAQAKEKDYPEVEDQLKRIVQSFRVPG